MAQPRLPMEVSPHQQAAQRRTRDHAQTDGGPQPRHPAGTLGGSGDVRHVGRRRREDGGREEATDDPRTVQGRERGGQAEQHLAQRHAADADDDESLAPDRVGPAPPERGGDELHQREDRGQESDLHGQAYAAGAVAGDESLHEEGQDRQRDAEADHGDGQTGEQHCHAPWHAYETLPPPRPVTSVSCRQRASRPAEFSWSLPYASSGLVWSDTALRGAHALALTSSDPVQYCKPVFHRTLKSG